MRCTIHRGKYRVQSKEPMHDRVSLPCLMDSSLPYSRRFSLSSGEVRHAARNGDLSNRGSGGPKTLTSSKSSRSAPSRGQLERVTLRVTYILGEDRRLTIVPNGEMRILTNLTRE